jgi:hypothetical protein
VFGDIYFDGSTVIAATNGQSWAGSAWVQVVAGTQNGVSSINLGLLQYDSGGVALGAATLGSPSATISTTWQRINRIGTTNNASIAFVRPQIAIGINSGVAIDITLRIGLPQLELGAFATSVIPTTTTALTRAEDVASVNTLSPWYSASAGTLFAEAQSLRPVGDTTRIAALSDGTANNSIRINAASTTQAVVTGGSTDASFSLTYSVGAVNKWAIAYETNNTNAALNGVAGTTDTTVSLPTVNQLELGRLANGASGSRFVGYLRRITYYPRRLSNAELVSITSP